MHIADAKHLIRYPLIPEVNVEMVLQYCIFHGRHELVLDLHLILEQTANEVILKRKDLHMIVKFIKDTQNH